METADKDYGVIVGDSGKTMVMRGLWTQKRGLSALRVFFLEYSTKAIPNLF